MSEVRAVLLVPAEGDPHGLLAEGPCGARPPMAYQCWNGEGFDAQWLGCDSDGPDEDPPHQALVLAWEGEPVAAGLDRAGRLFMAHLGEEHMGLTLNATMENALSLGRNCSDATRCKGGTLVLLDEQGREVTP